MAITIKDTAPRKRNIASLVGGYVIAAGAVFATAIGVWIRLADL